MLVLTNHSPLDFYDEYAESVPEWIGSAADDMRRFEDRSKIYSTARAHLEFRLGVKSIHDIRLRDTPHVHTTLKDFSNDDADNIIYWFIFKEENNGTTHKVCLSHDDIENLRKL